MSEHRRQILEMLGQGKITADEAERLIAALEKEAPSKDGPAAPASAAPKYLRVRVEAERDGDGDTLPKTVNIRVPLQLLRLEAEHEVAVIEMGMNHAGEIAALAKIAEPDWAVVTNVAPVHMEFFPDGLAGIARAKLR